MNSHLPFQPNILVNPLTCKPSNSCSNAFPLKNKPQQTQKQNKQPGITSHPYPVRHYSFSGRTMPSHNHSLNYLEPQNKRIGVQFFSNSQKILEENKKEEVFQRAKLIYSKQKEGHDNHEPITNNSRNPKRKQSRFHPPAFSNAYQQTNKEPKSILENKLDLSTKITSFPKTNNLKNEQFSQFSIPLKSAQANTHGSSKTDRDMMSLKQNHEISNFCMPSNLKFRKQISSKEHNQVHKELKELESTQNSSLKGFYTEKNREERAGAQGENSKINKNETQNTYWPMSSSPQKQLPKNVPFQQLSLAQKDPKQPDKKNESGQIKKKSNFQFFKNIKRKKLSCVLQQPPKSFRLGDFSLMDKLRKGAFGDVFIAQQKASGFLCVIKKLSKKKVKQHKLQEQVLREIKIQSYLNHRHLTSLFGYFDDQSNIYLILQLLPDGSMKQSKFKRKVPQNQASTYIKQIALGLKSIHNENVIHRDLKPQNIFLYENYAKIGDFGCSIHTNTYRSSQIGSLAYISPEQLKLEKYNEKIDIWSLGVIAYEMLLGVSPYENQILKIARKQMAPQLSELTFPEGTTLSSEAKDFLMGMLDNNPQKRFLIQEALKHQFIVKHNKQEDIKLQKLIY